MFLLIPLMFKIKKIKVQVLIYLFINLFLVQICIQQKYLILNLMILK